MGLLALVILLTMSVLLLGQRRVPLDDEYARLTLVNDRINRAISNGQYREALELATPHLKGGPSRIDEIPTPALLIQINAAEALYNLGRWDEALAVVPQATPSNGPLIASGSACQRAWILTHLGRLNDAVRLAFLAKPWDLPSKWQAEIHFARAVALMARGAYARAEKELANADEVIERPSSERNALFLRARLCVARGDLNAGDELFRAAASHPYQGQGGDGLLAWGDCLAKLGRDEDAHRAWELAVQRDPQSESAGLARARLGPVAARP